MKNKFSRLVLGLAVALAFLPSAAFASSQTLNGAFLQAGNDVLVAADQSEQVDLDERTSQDEAAASAGDAGEVAHETTVAAKPLTDYVIPYDRDLIDEIGTQEESGHTICCPSFSCAYADAVMDGTVHDHSYYTCSNCSWTDWGGGGSAFRSVGDDEELLREAYDEISAGRPTVIHVTAGTGEHWIALIGFQDAEDPDNLTLDNFIALEPWDGTEIVAGDKFSLYGDGCEHVSDR